jgi:hypothetical protein
MLPPLKKEIRAKAGHCRRLLHLPRILFGLTGSGRKMQGNPLTRGQRKLNISRARIIGHQGRPWEGIGRIHKNHLLFMLPYT